PNRRWAEKHRALTTQCNYKVREILNPGGKDPVFTLNQEFLNKYYSHRYISPEIIAFDQQIAIYNNTVAMYNWREDKKVGLEIINNNYAHLMRQVFEHYWQLAETAPKAK